jgi:hypothetical protein
MGYSRAFRLCLVGLATAFVIGCASAPKLSGAARIAIVSYALQKSIVKSGESYELGPVLPSQQSTYYQHHQEAIDRAWTEFKAKAPSIFASRTLVDFAEIEGNAELKAATASTPRKTLGIDLSAAGQHVFPAKLNYVSLKDAKESVKIAELLKADILIAFDLRAEYAMTDGLSFGKLKTGTASMRLTAEVLATDAAGKVLRRATVSATSKATSMIGSIGGLEMDMDHEEYPRLILSAQDELFAKLAKEVARW